MKMLTDALALEAARANLEIDRNGNGRTFHLIPVIKIIRMPDGTLRCENGVVPNEFFNGPKKTLHAEL